MYGLVDLRLISPSIVFDIRYATANNFVGKVLYPAPFCFLQEAAAWRLDKVERALRKKGMGLKVFDGYRPLSVTKIFWEFLPDPCYCADPAKGSRHNRGASVDAALVDAFGQELLMPSGYDVMGERAHLSYRGAPKEALLNRERLQEAMREAGFLHWEEEWWHFDDPDWESYPVLDLTFEQLQRFS